MSQQESKEVIIKLNNTLFEPQNSKNKAPYTCHVLPCQINYTGTTSTTSKYFHVVKVTATDLDSNKDQPGEIIQRDSELPQKATKLNTESNSILSSTATIIDQPTSTESSNLSTEKEPENSIDKQTYHYKTYFRGRLLKGVNTTIPDNYIGVLLKEGPCQSKVLPKNGRGETAQSINGDDDNYGDYDMGDAEDDYENDDTPVQTKLEKNWTPVVTFNKVVVWGHEKVPNKQNDQYLTAINDWINLSHIIHG